MPAKRTLSDRLALRLARAKRKFEATPLLRRLGGRGAATLALGAALSVGGLTDSLQNVHFLVEKNLDTVEVTRTKGHTTKVVARLDHDITGNTVFKLSQLLPERYVTRQLALFNDGWLPETSRAEKFPGQKKRDVFWEEMARINDAIRKEFFASSMPYGELIHEKAEKYDVDPALVAAVIEQESRFKSRARSHVGARGLMQLMPRTGRWMGARDLYDPEQNVDAGVKYIKYLEKRFDGNLKKTIAAYNAGEGNVRRYGGIPPFRETQHYVKKVLKNYDKRNKQLQKWEKEQLGEGGPAPERDGSLAVR